MGIRYTPEQLTRLRESPLVIKPPGLPPTDEWMGPPSDNARNQPKAAHPDRMHPERSKLPLLDQTNRRPALERHMSRGTANPEDIILGPPKTSFASATSLRNNNKTMDSSDRSSTARDLDSRDRYSSRKLGDAEDDRVRDGRGNTLRPKRGEGDQDSDGWSTVKPRKSFGTEGAERFNGRMGGDRRFRDRDDRDTKERPARGFDAFSREKGADQEQEGGFRRNGAGRGRNEPSWFKDSNDALTSPGDRKSNGDKFVDRNRGWREKEREDKVGDRGGDRSDDRADRRWDKDRRQERDPEWMGEPVEEKKQTHTQEDFQKWKERMKAGSGITPAEEAAPKIEPHENGGQSSFFGLEKPKVETPLIMDSGPDKFFGQWAGAKQDSEPEAAVGSKKEGVLKSKTLGKSSRFTSFFAPQEDPQHRQTEPPPPVPALPQLDNNPQASKEKEDFQRLLQKLQSQSFGVTSSAPAVTAAPLPKQALQERQPFSSVPIQDGLQQYRSEREPPRSATRDSQQTLQDLLGQRQTSISQPSARPEQVLQELVNQRHNAMSQSSSRPEQAPNRNSEFLMGLMQQARAAPESMRMEQVMLRMPPQQQPDRQVQQQMADHEQEMQQREQRERSASQRQQRRPEIPPGFYDEGLFQRGPPPQAQHHDNTIPRSQGPLPQPTQILQRPPPGLDQLPPGWGGTSSQLPPPMSQQQRHIAPPPGLPGGPNSNRGIAPGMPQQNMFPPGFPIGTGGGGFGPQGMPDGMIGAGPRNMPPPPPPPGFMMPPPGFMGIGPGGPGMPMSAFQQGPEMAYGGPFDARGGVAPQQGGGGFRRQ